jgi:hypothetical protein
MKITLTDDGFHIEERMAWKLFSTGMIAFVALLVASALNLAPIMLILLAVVGSSAILIGLIQQVRNRLETIAAAKLLALPPMQVED